MNEHPASENMPLEASVVVPSRGGAERLPRLIGALAAQEVAPPFDVHVVVDGDVDDSAAVLARLKETYPSLRLEWTVFPENRGRVAALNAGADATTGRILIRADDDLEPGPHYVRNHVGAHAGGPGGAIGLYLNVLPDTPYQRAYGEEHDGLHRDQAYALPPAQQWRHWAGNVSVPRALHEQIGGYDPDYRQYGWEDIDYGYRLHAAGYPVRIRRELETPHHAAAVTTATKAVRALHGTAARNLFIRKHGSDVVDSGPPQGLWGLAVRGLAAVTTEGTIRIGSNALDRLLDRLPRSLGRRLVALQVEAAAETGRAHPRRATRGI